MPSFSMLVQSMSLDGHSGIMGDAKHFLMVCPLNNVEFCKWQASCTNVAPYANVKAYICTAFVENCTVLSVGKSEGISPAIQCNLASEADNTLQQQYSLCWGHPVGHCWVYSIVSKNEWQVWSETVANSHSTLHWHNKGIWRWKTQGIIGEY